jgi:hypothetical protein
MENHFSENCKVESYRKPSFSAGLWLEMQSLRLGALKAPFGRR